jgi:hypothetical protein
MRSRSDAEKIIIVIYADEWGNQAKRQATTWGHMFLVGMRKKKNEIQSFSPDLPQGECHP